MKRFIAIAAIAAALVLVFTAAKPRNARKVAVFKTSIDCKNCVKKVQENISFEKGVTDLVVDLDTKTVKVTYNPSKTDPEKLAKAIRKLGYKVELIEDKSL